MNHPESSRPVLEARSVVALALAFGLVLCAGSGDAQTVTPEELLRLRSASAGVLDAAKMERLESALGARGAVLDSLREESAAVSNVRNLEQGDVPVTPPPDHVAPPSAHEGLTPFGYEIFANVPEGFTTDIGPVGPGYVVGTGDELVLTLWGDAELVQNATVDREGRVFFRDIGLVNVAGQRLEQVKRELGMRLEQVYSGIDGDVPTTFFDVTTGRLSTAQVFVFGEVTRPGAYRVPSNGTVLDVLYRAGGASPKGSLRRIRVVRGGRNVTTFDLYLALVDGDLTSDVRLETGDVVLIPPVGPRVRLLGEVLRPAIYELVPGETLRDLLRIAGGFTPMAYGERAIVERIAPTRPMDDGREYDWTLITLSRSHLSGDTPFPLEDGDRVEILRLSEKRGGFVELVGTGLWKPGKLAWMAGLTVGDAIDRAGGLRRDASLDEIQVIRFLPGEAEEVHSLRLDHSLNGHSDASFVLEEHDQVIVRARADFSDPDSVSVIGEIRAPGVYPHRVGLTLQDVIFQAGGLKNAAFSLHAEVARVDPTLAERDLDAEIFRVALDGWEKGNGEAARFLLAPHDQIHVWTRPGWQMQRNVRISGEVTLPGTYAISEPGERVSDLVARAGGLTVRAYPPGTVFKRTRGGTGRIALDLARALERPGDLSDVALEPGDEIVIPEEPHTVKVVGEIGFPSSIVHHPGKRVGYYIERAGGYTELSDRDDVLVTLASGAVKRGGGGFLRRSPRVDAGSVIFVPRERPKQEGSTLRDMANIVSILTGAATTAYLISQVSN